MSEKIAVDLDGVVFETEKDFRVLCEIYDTNNKSNTIINNMALKFQDRYNWSKEKCDDFYSKNVFDIEKTSSFTPGCIMVLNLLKDIGCKLYIISARGIFSEKQIEISKKRLKDANLDIFDEYIFKAENKKDFIKKYGIDIMIDDNIEVCKSLKDVCDVLYFKDAPSEINTDNKIKTVYNWGEVYRYIMHKINNS